jgi:predicted DNA-binding transcriptional regulator YafY
MATKRKRMVIMVSSTVYGIEELLERVYAILTNFAPGSEITPAEYRKRFASDVSERQARRDLKELEDLLLIVRKGGGAGTRYQRTNRT